MKKLFDVLQAVIGSGITHFQWQKGRGNYLAVSGGNHQVTIYNRQGSQVSVIPLPGSCTSLDWDKDGELLSITQDFGGILYLWNANTSETVKFDTGMKEGLGVSIWTHHSHLLAIGTLKGNLVLYNYRNRKKVPVLGKHSRKIYTGAWSVNNVLALSGEDKIITLSDKEGNTISHSEVKYEIVKDSLIFSPDGSRLSGICGHKELYIFDIDKDGPPLQLMFQSRYGELSTHVWIDNNQIMLGFSKGFMVVISRETGSAGEVQEVFQTLEFKGYLRDYAVSPQLPLIAAIGENSVKLHEFQDLKEIYASYSSEDSSGSFNNAQWTNDGQLLSISLKNGGVSTFLIQLPQLGSSSDTRVAYLTSLLEVTIINDIDEEPPLHIECPIEPSFLCLGQSHLAIGMNNRVWFTNVIDPSSKKLFNERSYIGTITDVDINGTYCAVLSNGGIELHQIESRQFLIDSKSDNDHPDERSFPDEGQNETITTHCLTSEYLIYGTESGSIVYFYLDDWQYINEYKHVVGISKLYPNTSGSRVVFCDDKSDCYIYNPIDDAIIEVPQYPPSASGLLWDNGQSEKNVFIIFDKEKVFTYVYYRDTVEGPKCVLLGATDLPHSHKPLLLHNGAVTCLNTQGRTKTIKLLSHNDSEEQELSYDQLKNSFMKDLALNHLKEAWFYAVAIDSKEEWNELANAALYHLDVPLAIRAFQQISNLSMVTSLQEIQDVEDRNLLVGYINMFKENYNAAQESFLKSSEPKTALEMRCDLLQWNQALELAKILAEDRLPFICKQYAEQLEFVGDYGNSLIHYERAITNQPMLEQHDQRCIAGVTRTALHTGDVRRGIKLAQSSTSLSLKLECAEILETLKLFSEAAVLYEQAENWQKAAQCYMKIKKWDKVGSLLDKIPFSVRLHSHYAKAREIDGHFKESAKAYETAQEYDNAIRVYLERLQQPEEAVRVANDSKSIDGAKLVANYFQKRGDFSSALQFLVMSKCNDEAYHMAESHGEMDRYGSIIGDDGTVDDYLRIATYYERNNEHFKAGTFFMKATEYSKSLDHLLQCPTSLYPNGDHINMAIKVTGLSRKDSLVQRLHGYLLGEVDGEPKEARFLFGMYLSLGQYREASQTAILIAKEDQNTGNYRTARNLLFQMYKDLKGEGIVIPNEMKQSLMLLHSYLLAKTQVKRGNHENAARLLIRVATNISKFPSHVVPILTSTVIECQRSGLKKSSFEFAAMLMRPEYRQQIDSKWKKKIEGIVRKPERSEVDDTLESCPYCQFKLPSMRLDCPQCKNHLPFCILTGKHMVKNDWTECPNCEFPALYSLFQSFIESGEACPLCGENCSLNDIKLLPNEKVQTKLINFNN